MCTIKEKRKIEVNCERERAGEKERRNRTREEYQGRTGGGGKTGGRGVRRCICWECSAVQPPPRPALPRPPAQSVARKEAVCDLRVADPVKRAVSTATVQCGVGRVG